jgi:hypothetical protein
MREAQPDAAGGDDGDGDGDGERANLENVVTRHLENPFLVLALAPDTDAGAVERQGQKLLAMLAAGLAEAGRYATPLGARARTPELVRAAMAELRDPERRLGHEWWARGWLGVSTGTGAGARGRRE